MKRYFICYVEGTDGGQRYKHWTLPSAEKEAVRLAMLTGRKVHIYEWKGTCQAQSVTWEVPR